MTIARHAARQHVRQALTERNRISRAFFAREAARLASACRAMSQRFVRGGRLLAFGRGPSATDAQHVAVEFVHPVLVGKRALPAIDLSASFQAAVPVMLRSNDIVMGFGPPNGDPDVADTIAHAYRRGAMTFALPGADGHYFVDAIDADPFVLQENVETLYHTLWETVHVFFEHGVVSDADAGAAGFLYPFLGGGAQDVLSVDADVAASILSKVDEDARLRGQIALQGDAAIVDAALAMAERVGRGGTLLLFGNGGSATDANDWALDCVTSPKGSPSLPALSLSTDPACLTALANDIGSEAMFLRQLIAVAQPQDVAVAISTSGGSANIIAALEEARRRGLLTVALLGYDGGEIVRRGLADCAIVVHSDYIPRIQEVHASIYHIVIDLLGTLVAAR